MTDLLLCFEVCAIVCTARGAGGLASYGRMCFHARLTTTTTTTWHFGSGLGRAQAGSNGVAYSIVGDHCAGRVIPADDCVIPTNYFPYIFGSAVVTDVIFVSTSARRIWPGWGFLCCPLLGRVFVKIR